MTAKLKHHTREYFLSAFDYCEETGLLTWKVRPLGHFKSKKGEAIWNAQRAGKVAGTKQSQGYVNIRIDRKRYYAHRLIWFMVNGEWPKDTIDHINGCEHDNSLKNLRVASQSENSKNRKLSSRNKSGVLGVSFDSFKKKWTAHIGVDGKPIRLGAFKDKFDAICIRKSAENKYGYHENHGRR